MEPSVLTARQYNLVTRRFSLDGQVTPNYAVLAREYGLNTTYVQDIESSIFLVLRRTENRHTLEQIVLQAAEASVA